MLLRARSGAASSSMPTAKALATAMPTLPERLCTSPRQRAHVAGELLGRGGEERVEDERDDRALAEAEQDEAGHHEALAPLAAHREGEQGEGGCHDDEPGAWRAAAA